MEKPDRFQTASFYFPDFFLNCPAPWFVHENFLEMEIPTLLQLLEGAPCKAEAPSLDWLPLEKNLFSSAFGELKMRFENKVLKKGVPFVFYESKGKITSENRLFLLKNALSYAAANPVYLYGFWDDSQGMLGATPEILFRHSFSQNRSSVETIACAGTCPKEDSETLLSDPKLLHEHQLVIEGIVEALSSFGTIAQGKAKILRLPHLSHLVTEIGLTAQGPLDFESLVSALHPTPALGAFPKAAGMEWLRGLQKRTDRGRFGAPVGVRLKDSSSKAFVAIRNAQWQNDRLKIGAGCGIVPESREEKEWEEIGLKIKAIKNILGL